MFDFGVLQPYVDDENITDIDTNSKSVFVTHNQKGCYKVLDLEEDYLSDLLNKLSNYPQIDQEFNYHNPILDGTMDGLRIHAVHKSIMSPYSSLSIRRNPYKLVVTEKDYPKIFALIKCANKLKWSYVFGGERGTGKTQFMRASIALLNENERISVISENDEMHLLELLPNRMIRPYIINNIIDYKECAKSVLRDNSDYVVFQEVRDNAIDDLFLILSSSSRVMTTLHIKKALLMPERMVELSDQKNNERLLSKIYDYIQMCIVPSVTYENGIIKRFIAEIALFWNDENNQQCKQLIYENDGVTEHYLPLPKYHQNILDKYHIQLDWNIEGE